MRLLHPFLDRIDAAVHLRDHPAGNDPAIDQPRHFLHGNTGKKRPFPVLYPFNIGKQDQLFRLESASHPSGHQICIDVVAFAIGADPYRCNDRDKFASLQGLDKLLVHRNHVADKADVDHLLRSVVMGDFLQHLFAEKQVAVLARQPDGPAAMLVEIPDHFLVDLARQHHLHHSHGRSIGYPHSPYELGDDPVPFQGFVDLGAPAMYHHGVDAQRLEQDNVESERFLEAVIGHGMAAVLYDNGLPRKPPDVRECLHQGIRFVDQLLHRFLVFSKREGSTITGWISIRNG